MKFAREKHADSNRTLHFLHMNINKTKVLRLIVVADGRILYQPKKQEEKQYQYKLKHNG